MNKYQEAINTLSELVERVTPKKPILAPNGNSEQVCECPNCHCRRRVSLDTRYCDWCGQALDWTAKNGERNAWMNKHKQAKDIKYELSRNYKLCKLNDNKLVLKDKWQMRLDLLEEISTRDEYIDKLNNALNKAIELLDANMLCEKCPFPHNTERCTVEGCREYLREFLLKGE